MIDLTVEQCELFKAVDTFGTGQALIRCQRIALRQMDAGCQHEHIMRRRWVCIECGDGLREGKAQCVHCLKLGHVCRMLTLEGKSNV